MNNVNMGGMNAMGGPVGGGMPMAMNNGAGPGRPTMPGNEGQRSQLNTYIYEYFLRHEMYDCARSLLNSEHPMSVTKDSPGRRRENGEDGGDSDNKDDVDSKRPSDLPEPNLPKECPDSCFLYEWWCLFWDMFNAQRGKGEGRNVMQYVNHTQAQSRLRQEQQQAMLRGGIRNGMIPPQYEQMMMQQQRGQQPNGMALGPNELRQQAIKNNNRNTTPQQQMMMAQQQKQNQQAMQRDPSEGGNQQAARSPNSAGEGAPSPSKRPRLDGTPSFNPQQMPNGNRQVTGMPQQVGDGPSVQAAHMQLANGIQQNNLTYQQFQNIPGGPGATAQANLGAYQANMVRQQAAQAGQMGSVKPMQNQGGPQNQGSPMMTPGQDNGAIANYYNPTENGMRNGPGGQPGGSGGNHALQDYQMQLMLLEQQNKKRLMMARQEQDSMLPRPDGGQGPAGAVGPNGQPFQGASPQGARNSPNPGDQMKRGTPHMNPAGIPSPLPEGQSRGSPSNGMNFNLPGGPVDPQYFNKMNGMDPNMVAGMPNNMRPPSSHPAGQFNAPMTQQQQQQMLQRQQQHQQQQQQQVGQGQWQPGPNGQMMPQQMGAQGPAQPQMGTPQQRNMPPPSVPATGPVANGRATSSPQQNPAPPTPSQTNKTVQKGGKKAAAESKDSKAKRTQKKGSNANLNAGATPSAETEATVATPTPATPITPVHAKSFNGQNGVVQPPTNGQPTATNTNLGVMAQQPDSMNFGMSNDFDAFGGASGMDFASAGNGNLDVLQDFDFDSFLNHDDAVGDGTFGFGDTYGLDGNEIGAD